MSKNFKLVYLKKKYKLNIILYWNTYTIFNPTKNKSIKVINSLNMLINGPFKQNMIFLMST